MENTALISIIIPCYNYAHYLEECFSNLQKQSYTNWECLLVDNNSTDNTRQVVEDYSKKDARIKYFYQPIKGPSAARNLGIKEAKGEYIQFLDADDLLQTNKFNNALKVFEKEPNTDIVYSGMRYFMDGNLNELYYSMGLNKANDRDWMCYAQGRKTEMLPELLKENIMVISSPLIKKKSLDEIGYFDESLAFNEDWELWLRFAFADKKFLVDKAEDSFVLVRVHKTSHSRNPFKMFLAGLVIGFRYNTAITQIDLKVKWEKKTQFAIYSLEKMLYQNVQDFTFFKSSISDLIKVLPDKKYIFWQKMYDKRQILLLKSVVKKDLTLTFIKYKL